jgi:hypothetical protein
MASSAYGQHIHGRRFARDMIVAVVALIFSILFIYYSRNTGHSAFVYWARSCWPGSPWSSASPSTPRSGAR